MTPDKFEIEIKTLIAEDNFDAARALLAEYAEPVPEALRSQPFRSPVAFRGSVDTLTTHREADMAINVFTGLSRAIRNGEFKRRIRQDPDQLRVVEEGDSWFQYPALLDEVIDNVVQEFAVYSLSAPGDTAEEMALHSEHVAKIRKYKPDVFMLSMGGNDVLGEGRFVHLLNNHFDGATVDDLIHHAQVDAVLGQLMGHYRTMLTRAFEARPNMRIFLHGYANALPREDGKWLGRALESKGISLKTGKEIVARLLDRLNNELAAIAAADPRIEFFDLRGLIKDHYGAWHDELHLKNKGYSDAAAPMIERLRYLARLTSAVSGSREAIGVTWQNRRPADEDDPMLIHRLEARSRQAMPDIPVTCDPFDRHCQDVAQAQQDLAQLEREFDQPENKEVIEARLRYSLDPRVASYEALIGTNDLDEQYVTELAFDAGQAVARIHVRTPEGGSGFGTGFLIGGNLLMTNNHVLPTRETARLSFATFNYQFDKQHVVRTPVHYHITGDVFLTSQANDYTIVSVAPLDRDGQTALSGFGHIPMLPRSGKALKREYVSIIQHPGGDYKKVALRNNLVVGRARQFIYYATDTNKGSSGSPVFNIEWQLVALHHMAIPDRNDPTKYEANRGVRVSAIIEDIATQRASGVVDADRIDSILQDIRRRDTALTQPAPVVVEPQEVAEEGDAESWAEEIDREGALARADEPEATRPQLSASAAYWPNSPRNAPDTWHLPAEFADTAFTLTPRVLEGLVSASHFQPHDGAHDRVIIALRGCRIADGRARAEDVASVRLIPATVNHEAFRCLIGCWDRRQGRLSVYTASTVPRRTGMKRYYDRVNFNRGGARCNMLPTGCYEYCVGTHVSARNGGIKFVLRLGNGPLPQDASQVTVLRTVNDLCYGTRDIWDRTRPADNIHPAFLSSSFSSLGCLTLPGTQAGQGASHTTGTGDWRRFRQAAGFDGENYRSRYDLVLVTGHEASAMAAAQAGMIDPASLTCLRHGSQGPAVKALQAALGLTRDGDFASGTKLALVNRQLRDLGFATGGFSPEMAQLMRIDGLSEVA